MTDISEPIFISKVLSGSISNFSSIVNLRNRPYKVIVRAMEYYGSGTDTNIYIVKSDLVNNGILGYFRETKEAVSGYMNITHQYNSPYISNTYNFTITDITNSLQTPTGNLLIVLEFYSRQ